MELLRGRTNRATYALLLLLIVIVFSIAVGFQIRVPGEIFLVLICVPRLHDLGKSGWWIATAIVGELVAIVSSMALGYSEISTIFGLIAMFLPAIVLLAIPGQEGPNRFGDPPPLGINWPRT